MIDVRAVALIGALFVAATLSAAESPHKILLIGGTKSHGPGLHDFPNGIRVLDLLLRSSPDLQAVPGLQIESYPDGWPEDSAFDAASTMVWYFDGLEQHPLLAPKRRARFEALMQAGVGLVVLHQATTVPVPDRGVDLARWLGGARHGMFDRATEEAQITVAMPEHPVSRGLAPFKYLDEFYPTIRWRSADEAVTPILEAQLHVEWRDGKTLPRGDPEVSTVAWAYQRPDGGRAFGYTGTHYLVSLDQPVVRKMLLNAIAWTAHIEVPTDGVRSRHPDAAKQAARE
jgi:type 1 glutamine amidotransferase